MRTFNDVKKSLEFYKEELNRESQIKRDHYIITGGNMSVIKKGVGQYMLDIGIPVPMVWETAKKKMIEFQGKCGGNIKLSMTKYEDWLKNNIDECKKLMKLECIQKPIDDEQIELSGSHQDSELESHPDKSESHSDKSESHPDKSEGNFIQIEMSCQSCPLKIKTCMICRFVGGINMDKFPWEIICNAPVRKN